MWRHLRGCHLRGLKFKFGFCREPSGGATSKGYFDFLRKIKKKMEILWVRHLSRGIWNFSKVCLILSAGGSQKAPPQRVLSWSLKFKLTFCRESSGGATSWWATFIKIKIKMKMEPSGVLEWRHLKRCSEVSEGQSSGLRRRHLRGI